MRKDNKLRYYFKINVLCRYLVRVNTTSETNYNK